MSVLVFTKVRETRQYTEVVYYRGGSEIGRETLNDDSTYDSKGPEPMTDEEIGDWS